MLEPGDLVYELNLSTKVGRSSKLQPVWKGSLLVTKVKQPTLYRIAGRKRSRWVHHDRLKACTDQNVPIWMKRLRNRLFAALEVPSSQPNEGGDAIGGQVSSDIEATGLEDISTIFTPPPPSTSSSPLPQPPPPTHISPNTPEPRARRNVQLPRHLHDYHL